MARLQILELPEGSGDDRPPFILVIDQADEATSASLGLNPPPDTLSPLEGLQRALGVSVAEQIGARAVLVFEDTIDIPANDLTLSESAATALHLDDRTVSSDITVDNAAKVVDSLDPSRHG